MSRLEIIHLRMFGEPPGSLGGLIEDFARVAAQNKVAITVYRPEGLATDVGVHIRHLEVPAREEPCPLALRLASALRDYGLVEHTVWEELE